MWSNDYDGYKMLYATDENNKYELAFLLSQGEEPSEDYYDAITNAFNDRKYHGIITLTMLDDITT